MYYGFYKLQNGADFIIRVKLKFFRVFFLGFLLLFWFVFFLRKRKIDKI